LHLVKNKGDNTVSIHLLSMRDMSHITTLNPITTPITPITTHIHTTTVVITTLISAVVL